MSIIRSVSLRKTPNYLNVLVGALVAVFPETGGQLLQAEVAVLVRVGHVEKPLKLLGQDGHDHFWNINTARHDNHNIISGM